MNIMATAKVMFVFHDACALSWTQVFVIADAGSVACAAEPPPNPQTGIFMPAV